MTTTVTGSGAAGLTDHEQRVLEFEARWWPGVVAGHGGWQRPGVKDQAIRDHFGLSPVSYYQVLNRLLDSLAALAAWPLLVNLLRGRRDAQRRARWRRG